MKVVALAGGSGSAKLLGGLAAVLPRLTVIANVGDNYWTHGLYVCPDVDIAMYSLAGIADPTKGWGIRGDRFNVMRQLGRLGEETWFRVGDMDLTTSLLRTKWLRSGYSLTEVTSRLRQLLGVRHPILPATDSEVETRLLTDAGSMHLQEYWVKNMGRPRVRRISYEGAARAHPSPQVARALTEADRVIVCPANPVTSVGPILAIEGMTRLLARSRARVVALSPMMGRRPFSGPAGRLMRQLGLRPDSVGVASLYSGFVDVLVIDRSDAEMGREVERMGVRCLMSDTLIADKSGEKRMASVLLSA
jgi:LPPG:FO 2-phospho-L-lactate transferase